MTLDSMIVPLVLCGVLLYGLYKQVDVFSTFLEGAKEGLSVAVGILPALVALMTCIGMFKASGVLDALTVAARPIVERLGLPAELLPLAVLRPISGSGALVIFENVLREFGPDSTIGRIASVMMGSSETTFYTIAVYFGAVRISKTRYALPAALTADITGFLMSALMVRLFFPAG